jgi:RNA polymerase sigma factor (TIGR02999 family)
LATCLAKPIGKSQECTMTHSQEATKIVNALGAGDRSRAERLIELVYDELRNMAGRFMAQEDVGHTLQPTALVNEVFLKLIRQDHVDWQGRSHFLAIGAQAMRRFLVDYARTKKRYKRGGGLRRIELNEGQVFSTGYSEDVLALDAALQELAELNPRHAQIVELRFFSGMSMDEIAEVLGISKRTVERDWTMLRAWLRQRLAEESDS